MPESSSPIVGYTNNITAQHGQNTGPVTVATFYCTCKCATPDWFTATIPGNGDSNNNNYLVQNGGWGDQSPCEPYPSFGSLVITAVGADLYTGNPLFQVTASHTYSGPLTCNPTLFNLIVLITPTVDSCIDPPCYSSYFTLVGDGCTQGVATVYDAPFSGSNGTVLTGIEGQPLQQNVSFPCTNVVVHPSAVYGKPLIATFTDANQISDFDPNGYLVTINWGDGSSPSTSTGQPFPDISLVKIGKQNGWIVGIYGCHTYKKTGVYNITIVVASGTVSGSVAIISASAVISDAPLNATHPQSCITVTEGNPYKGPVGTFADCNPCGSVSDFTALIDWGEGNPLCPGSISQQFGPGSAFTVCGIHTYACEGIYDIQVFVKDVDGSRLVICNRATVGKKKPAECYDPRRFRC